jgi:hypothetical protein
MSTLGADQGTGRDVPVPRIDGDHRGMAGQA